MQLICNNCHANLNVLQRSLTCPQCSANEVEFQLTKDEIKAFTARSEESGIWRYREVLPKFEKRISLREGNTPIFKAKRLYKDAINLFIKFEGNNPTGSFFDRVSPLMTSDALSRGMTSMVCASDGNLGASISAYCASAGLNSICVVPKGIAPEKKAQMIAYGAEILDFGETIEESLDLAKKMTNQSRYQATPEFNLLSIEGIKTISYEIVEQFTKLSEIDSSTTWIEYIIVPMGSGRLLYSLWKGFKEASELGILKESIPKIVGVQIKGSDPITSAIYSGDANPKIVKKESRERFLADAIIAQNSLFGSKAIQSIRDSNGTSISITEKEMLLASKKLAQIEGIYAELSSATTIAAIEKLQEIYLKKDTSILALITGSGMKTSLAFQSSTAREKRVESFRNMGTKIEILHIIATTQENFGYSIWKSLGQSLSLQAVYQHLKELAKANHIEEIKSMDRQKRYTLTEKGIKLMEKMNELENLLH